VYDPDLHHRRSIRLPNHDYSSSGGYFVTLCAQDRECLFGEVTTDGEVSLNGAGQMVERWWVELERKFPGVRVDAYVIMPNHFHGIVEIDVGAGLVGADLVGADLRVCPDPNAAENVESVGADLRVCPDPNAADSGTGGAYGKEQGAHAGAPLHSIVQWFKTMTTNEYIRNVKDGKWPPFNRRVWQRNYYERVIRHESEWERITQYIAENPARWTEDLENPNHV
jgi:putative transposase